MDRNEALIIEQLRLGNEEAYRHLFKYHYPVLCHFAEGFTRDEFLAETIVGDTIFHLWEIREKVEITTSIRSYLLSAVRNRCLDFLNSRYYQKEIQASRGLGADFPVLDYVRDNSSGPLGSLLEKELENEIGKAVESLPEQTHNVFCLSRFEGKTYKEIAATLGISENTVKYHIKQALALLRAHLGEYLSVSLALMIESFFK